MEVELPGLQCDSLVDALLLAGETSATLKRAAMPSHGDIQRGKPSARWKGAMSSEYWLMGWRCMWLGMVWQSLNLLAWLTNQKRGATAEDSTLEKLLR